MQLGNDGKSRQPRQPQTRARDFLCIRSISNGCSVPGAVAKHWPSLDVAHCQEGRETGGDGPCACEGRGEQEAAAPGAPFAAAAPPPQVTHAGSTRASCSRAHFMQRFYVFVYTAILFTSLCFVQKMSYHASAQSLNYCASLCSVQSSAP